MNNNKKSWEILRNNYCKNVNFGWNIYSYKTWVISQEFDDLLRNNWEITLNTLILLNDNKKDWVRKSHLFSYFTKQWIVLNKNKKCWNWLISTLYWSRWKHSKSSNPFVEQIWKLLWKEKWKEKLSFIWL